MNFIFNNQEQKGFSLLELTIVLIITTILASAAIPQLIKGYSVNAANKVALDMAAIQESARAYYIANNAWPSNIAALQTGNFLPAAWNGINPFGQASSTPANYSYSISSNNALLSVSTLVPTAALSIIQNLLPVTSVSGNTIYSSVPVPGGSSVMPAGIIAAWSGSISSIPSGWVLCNGVTVAKSDGSGTITAPDLRDRFVVGARQDFNGTAMTNVTGSLTQSGNGQLPATTAKLNYGISNSGPWIQSPVQAITISGLYYANIAYIFSTSFGSGPYNIAVYYALAYIMKT